MEQRTYRIVLISDLDATGSGYSRISHDICSRLAQKGHKVRVLGLNYNGSEFPGAFSIYACANLQDAKAMLDNICIADRPDVIIGAMDIPWQNILADLAKNAQVPYICITPMESEPLCITWSLWLHKADKVYVMSELAKQECIKRGIQAEHLPIGMDTEAWRQPVDGEREQIRNSLGIGIDEFVVLAVADNQERKNLWALFDIVAKFKELEPEKKVRLVLVTRENATVGWRLRDMAMDMHINSELLIFERGLPFKVLWGLYAMADVYVNTSKGEGLGLPVLEAMSVGVPVVACATGALKEHLSDGRGYLVNAEYIFCDPWGNSNRYMINREGAARWLQYLSAGSEDVTGVVKEAHKYVEARTCDRMVEHLLEGIEEVVNVKKKS